MAPEGGSDVARELRRIPAIDQVGALQRKNRAGLRAMFLPGIQVGERVGASAIESHSLVGGSRMPASHFEIQFGSGGNIQILLSLDQHQSVLAGLDALAELRVERRLRGVDAESCFVFRVAVGQTSFVPMFAPEATGARLIPAHQRACCRGQKKRQYEEDDASGPAAQLGQPCLHSLAFRGPVPLLSHTSTRGVSQL